MSAEIVDVCLELPVDALVRTAELTVPDRTGEQIDAELVEATSALFGARGTGKSTWLQEVFNETDHLWISSLSYSVDHGNIKSAAAWAETRPIAELGREERPPQ